MIRISNINIKTQSSAIIKPIKTLDTQQNKNTTSVMSFTGYKNCEERKNIQKTSCALLCTAAIALASIFTTSKLLNHSDVETAVEGKNEIDTEEINDSPIRTEEENKKVLLAKEMLDTANKDYKEIVNSLWQTKIGISKNKEQPEEGLPLFIKLYGKETYDSLSKRYQNIMKIISGEKIWQGVKTANDAINLIRNTICEANSIFANDTFNHTLTSSAIINTGEYAAIVTLLDGLAGINEETKIVSDTYRLNLDFAAQKTAEDLNDESVFESNPSIDADDLTLYYFDEIKEICFKLQTLKQKHTNLLQKFIKAPDYKILNEIARICSGYNNTYEELSKFNYYRTKSENSPYAIYQNRLREAIRYSETSLSYKTELSINPPVQFQHEKWFNK